MDVLFKSQYEYFYSYQLEQVINTAIYSLLVYGKAYLIINLDYYDKELGKDGACIASIGVNEIKGFAYRKCREVMFCSKTYSGDIEVQKIYKANLVMLDLRELGFGRSYFRRIIKKLGKLDILSATRLTEENIEGYDFMLHTKRLTIKSQSPKIEKMWNRQTAKKGCKKPERPRRRSAKYAGEKIRRQAGKRCRKSVKRRSSAQVS